MYEDQTSEVILTRMLADVDPTVDSRQGSIVYDMIKPPSNEAARLYVELDNVLELGFIDTSNGEWLTLKCAEDGVNRKLAQYASGTLKFTGTNGTLIPAGTRVSTNSTDPIYYVTISDGTIAGGFVNIAAEAETAGIAGNTPAINAINVVLGNLSGVVTVTNEAQFAGGTEEETDDELKARHQEEVTKPITSGNPNHYIAWAKEVSGVGDARCVRTWNGPGTVKVIVISTAKKGALTSTVNAVQAYLEAQAPIGAQVTAISATEVPINISVDVTLNGTSTLTDATNDITAGIVSYLASLAFKDSIVRYSKIANIVGDSKYVSDYASLTINGGIANITIGNEQVAVIGTVNVT